ncbi:hypothetical protein DWU98_14460 [Dyella monticola]|uniref:Dermonecrotic toxin N-terminal domain-containing protein n=1 Tax=Dyella monticola TaxID=1927958 RepID=A0A370WVD2_9GAMM|nr:DUF6543 domain-containing protein [Dyella monticola]RDS80113.1 hypothetical protein DWU98_14460 [Dyella monticola]
MQNIANLPPSLVPHASTSNNANAEAVSSENASSAGPLVSPQRNPFNGAANGLAEHTRSAGTLSPTPHASAPSTSPRAQAANTEASSAALPFANAPSASRDVTRDPLSQYLQELQPPPAPPTPQATTSDWLHRELKAKYGLDVDPDHTYLVNLKYNTGGNPNAGPYPGEVERKESLTDATMHNTQDPPTVALIDSVVPYRSGGPDIQVTSNLPIKPPGIFSFHRHDEQSDYTYTYEGIYKGGDDSRYSPTTQLPIDPNDFHAMVWQVDPIKIVDSQLDTFWSDNEKNYSQQARLSFTGVAYTCIPRTTATTHQPGDLQPADLQLAARMVQQPPSTEIATGRLSIGGYVSTDVMYAQDKNGRILLYTPGGQPSLQGFDSVAELRSGLANAMKDSARCDALQRHFKAYDQQDGTDNVFGKAGVRGILNGLAAYPDVYAPPTLFWHKGQWNPDSYVALAPQEGDPFEHLTQDVKARSYADAQTLVTSDRDVTERTALKWANIVCTVLGGALAPLSVMRVGVSLLQKAVTAGDLASASASLGVGVDQTNRNKPEGTASIVNGLMPLVLLGALKGGESGGRKFAQGDVDSPLNLQPSVNPSNPPSSKPFFNTPARTNGRIGYVMGPQRAPKWASSKSVNDRIGREFILPEHMDALAHASKKGHFAVSFRKAGALTLEKLAKGAAAKGHDILEKTIKESSISAYYPKDYATIMQKLKAAGIDGYVGHWEEGKGLVGIYLRGRHGLRNVEEVTEHGATHYIYPIDLDHLTESLAPLKSLPEWERIPFTGDYDMHDMITFRGAGKPRTVLTASKEESSIINRLNEAISKVDKNRPHTAFAAGNTLQTTHDSVIRHGPQVNYPNFRMIEEKEFFKKKGLILAVAESGEFPIAMVNKGHWSIIKNIDELHGFYKKAGATLKETWKDNGAVKYNRHGYIRTNSQGVLGKRATPEIPRNDSSSSASSHGGNDTSD